MNGEALHLERCTPLMEYLCLKGTDQTGLECWWHKEGRLYRAFQSRGDGLDSSHSERAAVSKLCPPIRVGVIAVSFHGRLAFCRAAKTNRCTVILRAGVVWPTAEWHSIPRRLNCAPHYPPTRSMSIGTRYLYTRASITVVPEVQAQRPRPQHGSDPVGATHRDDLANRRRPSHFGVLLAGFSEGSGLARYKVLRIQGCCWGAAADGLE